LRAFTRCRTNGVLVLRKGRGEEVGGRLTAALDEAFLFKTAEEFLHGGDVRRGAAGVEDLSDVAGGARGGVPEDFQDGEFGIGGLARRAWHWALSWERRA
jgi:hypothetical protein